MFTDLVRPLIDDPLAFEAQGQGVIYENIHEYALFRITRLETVKYQLMLVPAILC